MAKDKIIYTISSKHQKLVDWCQSNCYDESQFMPKSFIMPDTLRKKCLNTFKWYFIAIFILWALLY